MCCADCEYRQKDYCCLLDDAVLSLYNSCFMDTSRRIENES